MNKSVLLKKSYTKEINNSIKVTYEMTSSFNLFDEYGEVEEFGIKLTQLENNEKSELLIDSISPDEQEVLGIIETLYSNCVTIVTAKDIIEDYIFDKYYVKV